MTLAGFSDGGCDIHSPWLTRKAGWHAKVESAGGEVVRESGSFQHPWFTAFGAELAGLFLCLCLVDEKLTDGQIAHQVIIYVDSWRAAEFAQRCMDMKAVDEYIREVGALHLRPWLLLFHDKCEQILSILRTYGDGAMLLFERPSRGKRSRQIQECDFFAKQAKRDSFLCERDDLIAVLCQAAEILGAVRDRDFRQTLADSH